MAKQITYSIHEPIATTASLKPTVIPTSQFFQQNINSVETNVYTGSDSAVDAAWTALNDTVTGGYIDSNLVHSATLTEDGAPRDTYAIHDNFDLSYGLSLRVDGTTPNPVTGDLDGLISDFGIGGVYYFAVDPPNADYTLAVSNIVINQDVYPRVVDILDPKADQACVALAYNSSLGLFANATAIGVIATGTDGFTWTPKRFPPLNTQSTLNNVCAVNTGFIAVGDAGRLVFTSDGETWVNATSGTIEPLYSGAYGASTYVVVGATGTILSSTDGVVWTSETSGTVQDMQIVIWVEDLELFIAAGTGGEILTSPDGSAWNVETSGTTANITDMVFDGTNIVAVCDDSTTNTSADGATWSNDPSNVLITRLVWDDLNGLYIGTDGVNDVYSSADALAWVSAYTSADTVVDVETNGAIDIACTTNTGDAPTSPDGTTWTTHTATGFDIYIPDTIAPSTKMYIKVR